MKKIKLNPLELDKETIASLNSKQLREVIGGNNHRLVPSGNSTGCGSGGSNCTITGGSTGCGNGGSQCFI
ncbi:Bacteriocin-type signal sequence-containing protein [Tenacibaculum sp. 190524A02b]|uniref:Bacteriocin-type signal sequence-containing protein n=1 Tax=Tenacibaculum vairaonense TaxID=3137860 RepID=A0ABM9PPV2_9FLAO